jgi:hypothetical protein
VVGDLEWVIPLRPSVDAITVDLYHHAEGSTTPSCKNRQAATISAHGPVGSACCFSVQLDGTWQPRQKRFLEQWTHFPSLQLYEPVGSMLYCIVSWLHPSQRALLGCSLWWFFQSFDMPFILDALAAFIVC